MSGAHTSRLGWAAGQEVAMALVKTFPDADRANLSAEDVRQYVVSLDSFDDTPAPADRRVLDFIRWQWMRLADLASAQAAGA